MPNFTKYWRGRTIASNGGRERENEGENAKRIICKPWEKSFFLEETGRKTTPFKEMERMLRGSRHLLLQCLWWHRASLFVFEVKMKGRKLCLMCGMKNINLDIAWTLCKPKKTLLVNIVLKLVFCKNAMQCYSFYKNQ